MRAPTFKTLTILGVTYNVLFNNPHLRVLYPLGRSPQPYIVQAYIDGLGWTTTTKLRTWQALKLAGSITTNVAIYNTEDR